jgi:hypothetical protein
MLMTNCCIHGPHISLHVSREVSWAMFHQEKISIDCAVIMLMCDNLVMLSCVVSQEDIRRCKLISGPIDDKARFFSNDEWIRQLVPVCGQCFLNRFGPLPQLDPSSLSGTGYYIWIQDYSSSASSS